MAKTWRVAVIGRSGHGNYGHGLDTVWSHVPNVEVVAVADDNKSALPAALRRTGAKTPYTDYRQMLERERPEIVAVAPRWIDRHHEILLECAEHGCHVYMEKPFVRTMAEADDVIDQFEMKHLKLAIAHTNRYTPQLEIARKLIADGVIGDVLEYRARGKEDARRGGGEDLWVLGTHMLDLMRAFAGDVESIYATVRQGGKPVTADDVTEGNEGIGPLAGDAIDAMYRFENGTTGWFASHRGTGGRPSRFGLKIFGSRGVIQFQSGFLRPAFLLRSPGWASGLSGAKWEPITSAGVGQPEPIKVATHAGGNQAAVEDLLAAIVEDRTPVSSMYDARAATEMIAGVFESHRQGGPVQVPLKNRENPLTMLRS